MENDNKEEKSNTGIDKLQKDLYARDESEEITSRHEALSELTEGAVGTGTLDLEPDTPEFTDVMGLRAKKRKKILIGVGIGITLLLILMIAFFGTRGYRNSRMVTSDQIALAAFAPTDFTSGDDITYTLNYANDSKVDWENVEISFTPPKGFLFKESNPELQVEGSRYVAELGSLTAGQSGQMEITGSLIGEQETVALANFDVSVVPTNFAKASIKNNVQVSTVIAAVPLEVSIEASEKASTGDRVLATIRVRNVSNAPITGVYVKLDPSIGSQLAVEDSEFSEGFMANDALWELPSIESLDEVERVAVLYVEGQEGEHRPLKVEVGIKQEDSRFVQRNLNHLITMATSELFVEQVYNDSNESQTVYPGEEVSGVIRYKNVGTVGLKNVIIELSLEGTGFDPATLQLENGSYDPTTRKIRWSAATVPELATLLPQGEGEIRYSFSILETDRFPTDVNVGGEGFSLISIATIDSPDLPVPRGQDKKVISNRHVLSIGTDLILSADAFYDDGRLGIDSYGPLPPKVGEETAYTVRFRLGSTLNAVGDTTLTAVLPDGVKYTGKNFKTSGNLEYNDRTGEIFWAVPLIDKLTGRTKPPHELHIQVSITPGENQRGREVQLVRSINASGTDLFVNQEVERKLDQTINTETASPQNGRVE